MKILKLLITNITPVADLNIHLSTAYQFFKFTITNVSAPYAVCGSIIVMCMFATTLRNLIYKVLNLAILSVFVVALWAYLTDVTFIYVVYILTFVSAVVMLFLSVVLMLPSSAIAVTKRNFSFVLLTAIAGTSENSIVSTIVNTTTCIVALSLTLVAVYFVIAYIKSWKVRWSQSSTWGHPQVPVVLTGVPRKMWPSKLLPEYYEHAIRAGHRFAGGYFFYTYDRPKVNYLAVMDCKHSSAEDANFGSIEQRLSLSYYFAYFSEYGQKPVLIPALNVLSPKPLHAPSDHNRCEYPLYIRAVPRIIDDDKYYSHDTKRLLGMVLYEFINFYVYRIEPDFLKYGGFKLYNNFIRPIRAYANAGDDWLARYCYTYGGRSPILFYAGRNPKCPVYISIYSPWWSPFRVFNGSKTTIHWTPEQLQALRFVTIYILLSKLRGHFYRGITRVISRISDNLKAHPALALKLSGLNGNKALVIWYAISAGYFRCVNFIFTNIEMPLSSKTDIKSGFSLFKEYYDFLVPAYSLSVPIGYNISSGAYTRSNTRSNKLIFVEKFIIFTIINLAHNLLITATRAVIFLTSPANLEIIAQIVTTFSVFFIAIPVGLTGAWMAFAYSAYLINAGSFNFVENLAAVQHGLYVGQPLLLLASITGLLVALIGAPFFVSKNNK